MMDRTMGDPRAGVGMDRAGVGMDHHRSAGPLPPGGPAGPMHGRSRSTSRAMPGATRGPGFHSLDREGYGDRDFMPIREPRERSLDRGDFMGPGPGGSYGPSYGAGGTGGMGAYGRRERSLDRRDPMLDPMGMDDGFGTGGYRSDIGAGLRAGDPMMRPPPGGGLGTRLSPNPIGTGPIGGARDPYLNELHISNSELQRDLSNLKKELDLTNQKLGSSMHSIKTFWSPELKKERALRKEESAKYSLINDQLKLLNSENQVSWHHHHHRVCVHGVSANMPDESRDLTLLFYSTIILASIFMTFKCDAPWAREC